MSEPTRWRRPARGQTDGVGIYDRDYYRQERSGFSLSAPRTAIGVLILINAVVFLAELFFSDQNFDLAYSLAAHVGTLKHPWLWWQFVTYGFVHDTRSLQHLLFNMLTLWFLGRDIESRYGTKEFIRVYLVLLVVGSVGWALANLLHGAPDRMSVIGASGAIAGIVTLYAFNFPHRMMLFMFVVPMPAWMMGVVVVAIDMLGATGWTRDTEIAYAVHLAGAAFALVYFKQGWNFGRLLHGRFHWPQFRARPKLRIHDPADDDQDAVPEEEVDRILEKIHREGESSLTRKERRILETASREYQKRRRVEP